MEEIHSSLQIIPLIDPVQILRIQCAGPNFMRYLARKYGNDDGLSNASSIDKISDDNCQFEIDIDYLRSLDPKEWKDQDHYHVLGLKNLRFDATEDDIKRAYRKIVLKHHPDKRKAQGEEIFTDDDYFTCITKAYETLGNSIKRRSYDSIDPEFDDSLPTQNQIDNQFYQIFDKYFKLNARWSEKKNVPEIGNEHSTRQDVDQFYNFWYDFESWREYSYLDEEDKDKAQDREERRWIDKQNKVIRIKRKKEEMSRIRALVDLAYNNDPRIIKFRNEEKEKKQAAKRARMNAVQAQRAEEERIIREAQLAREKLEQLEQKRIEQLRLEKEQQKRLLKKERKFLRDFVKEQNYFSIDTDDDKVKIRNMEGVEKICESLKLLELQEFNKKLVDGGRTIYLKQLKETDDKLEAERLAIFAKKTATVQTAAATTVDQQNKNSSIRIIDKNAMWTNDVMQLLIKAVNLFPAGTVQRWEVIANYLNQHAADQQQSIAGTRKFQARDVLNKAKDLQSNDFTKNLLKSQANDNAFASFEKNKKELKIIDKTEISVNIEKITNTNTQQDKTLVNGHINKKNETIKKDQIVNGNSEVQQASTSTNVQTIIPSDVWTKDEQALLEQAIRTYPISTVDRWDRIAECIPNKTKKQCLRRVKELVDRVNAKREAQQSIK